MVHLPVLIEDLVIILATAGFITVVFKKLRLPIVLGYLLSGLMISPHVSFFPSVRDTANIQVWADIGVIFLMFGLGLDFSLKKLSHVGKGAFITAIIEVSFMFYVGYFLGRTFGWNLIDSLFLGGVLSISSTSIIVRALDELGLKNRKFVPLALGVVIVEDIVAVVLMVILSTVAVSRSFSGLELVISSGKLFFFLILWFVVGLFAIPMILHKMKNHLSNETILIISISLCLLMALVAARTGFSPALGAFVMGSILAETREGKRIEHIIQPVKDLFSAVFFVSVGMLINPTYIINNFGLVILICAVTIIGKIIGPTVGGLIAGQTLRTSIQTGMSLGQIGEFSFIIATLGLKLKVINEGIYPLAVAVSSVTTLTTPFFMKWSDPVCKFVEEHLPNTFLQRLERYQASFRTKGQAHLMGLLWNAFGFKLMIHSVLIIALALGGRFLLRPLLERHLGEGTLALVLTGAVILAVTIPFLRALIFSRPSSKIDVLSLARLKGLQFGITTLRLGAGFLLTSFVLTQAVPARFATLVFVLIAFGIIIFLSSSAEKFYLFFENRLTEHLEHIPQNELEKASSTEPHLAPWDASLARFVLSPHSELIGKTLLDSELRKKFGVTVTLIERGNKKLLAPGRHTLLMPFDKLFLIGTEEQLSIVQKILEAEAPHVEATVMIDSFGLEPVVVNAESPALGKSILLCGIREAIQGLIVGIERQGKRILNPESDVILQENDLLWVVGDRSLIKKYKALPKS